MDEDAFRLFLKRKGKKAHVVDGLVENVRQFENYLNQQQASLDTVNEQHIVDYQATLFEKALNSMLRSLALYYQFVGNDPLAEMTAAARAKRIAKTQQAFKLNEFMGVHAPDIATLEAVGIRTVADMREAGKTAAAWLALSEQTGLAPETILELVKLSDLARLRGVKGVRARLYYDAGIDTPEACLDWEPEALLTMLTDFVQRTDFPGIVPLPKEIRSTIEQAKSLPKVIEYE